MGSLLGGPDRFPARDPVPDDRSGSPVSAELPHPPLGRPGRREGYVTGSEARGRRLASATKEMVEGKLGIMARIRPALATTFTCFVHSMTAPVLLSLPHNPPAPGAAPGACCQPAERPSHR